MKNKLTSIIMTCYDQTQTNRHVSMLAVTDITRYTNPSTYELIVVDCCPKYPFRDEYKCLKIDNFIKVGPPDIGYYPAMNLGASKAKGEYLCFIENDVMVRPNWLTDLRWYLENDRCDAILPNQIPCSFDQQCSYEKLTYDEAYGKGAPEQGLVFIRRESFDKMGGWDKKLKAGYGWRRFYQQLGENRVRRSTTAKVTISHITGMTYFDTMVLDKKKFERNNAIEGKYLLEKS